MKFLILIFFSLVVLVSCHQKPVKQKTKEEISANKKYYESLLASEDFYNYLIHEPKSPPVEEEFFKKTSVLTCARKTKIVYSDLCFYFCDVLVSSDFKQISTYEFATDKIQNILYLCRNNNFEIIDQKSKKRIKDIFYSYKENNGAISEQVTFGYYNTLMRLAIMSFN